MEKNISQSMYIGVAVMVFIAAVTVALNLTGTISKMATISLDNLGEMDKNMIERLDVAPAYVVTGADIISYYSNYIMPENASFEFYLDRTNSEPLDSHETGYDTGIENTLDKYDYIARCDKIEKGNQTQFTKISSNLDKYFIKFIIPEDDVIKVYFINGYDTKDESAHFLKCISK